MGSTFGSVIIDVAISLALVYVLLALFCSTANEWVAGMLDSRAKYLEQGLKQLLDRQPFENQPFLDHFFAHPVITGMKRAEKRFSYLPARTFATTVIDLITPPKTQLSFGDLAAGIDNLPDGNLKRTLLALVSHANGDLATAQKSLEQWYDDAMERVSGWYRRSAQWRGLLIAAIVTIAINADTLNIVHTLFERPAVTASIVERAKARASTGQSSIITGEETAALASIIGWHDDTLQKTTTLGWLQRILGWILTIGAASLGATFWFDALRKLVNLRSTGANPVESDEKKATASAT